MALVLRFSNSKVLNILLLSGLVSVCSAGLRFKFPFPFISFQNPRPPHKNPQEIGKLHHNHNRDQHHNNHHIANHVHQDQTGSLYLHDLESTVKFYYKENMHGPSNQVDIHDDGCREVPYDYWYNRPKSLWAKHCITLYQSGHCKGTGIQVAGMVTELRSAGMNYGVNSFKPCEKNIKIKFMPSSHHKPPHHHHTQQ